MSFDPQRYVVRTGPDTWALLPFTEDVCDDLRRPMEPLSAEATLAAIAEMDVSLVYEPNHSWDVDWRHGAHLREADLRECDIYLQAA